MLTQWFVQAEAATQKVVGNRPDLSLQNFQTVDAWLEAVANAKVETAKAEYDAQRNIDLEKLSEAKAVDLITAQRAHLPNPDLTTPVAGGGTPRKWSTYAEASALLNSDEITLDEFALAKQWLDEGRIRFA